MARPVQMVTVVRNPAGAGRSPCWGVARPVACYPGSLFLVFFLLVGVLWDTPGTGVSSSQWSTSPVCLFLLLLFPGDWQSPLWEGYGLAQQAGDGRAVRSFLGSSQSLGPLQARAEEPETPLGSPPPYTTILPGHGGVELQQPGHAE